MKKLIVLFSVLCGSVAFASEVALCRTFRDTNLSKMCHLISENEERTFNRSNWQSKEERGYFDANGSKFSAKNLAISALSLNRKALPEDFSVTSYKELTDDVIDQIFIFENEDHFGTQLKQLFTNKYELVLVKGYDLVYMYSEIYIFINKATNEFYLVGGGMD